MNFFNNRIKIHTQISRELSSISEQSLSELLDNAKPMHTGIGGKSVLLIINGTNIFVKKVPLTDLEQQPKNLMSTANIFELPLFYQYGIGSAGFGAWRELAAHTMTTEWVLAGECPNFPILYHWRVLKGSKPEPMNAEQLNNLKRDVKYWEGNKFIQRRLEDIHNASAAVLLFLEYVPHTLHQWLGLQLSGGVENTAREAISLVEKNLRVTTQFMKSREFSHFDAHFANILTDGKLLYFSDFGLALSSKFKLSNKESKLLRSHHNYDQCSCVTNLLHCLISSLFGNDHWEMRLHEYMDGQRGEIAPFIAAPIKRYAPIAFVMDDFYTKLQKKSKSTQYPSDLLDRLLSSLDDASSGR